MCISKSRDSKVLTLAASDDVSAVCGNDGCDGSQLMQSGFGKTTKIQGGPDRRPEGLKDLADRLVQAKQDVGNWGGFWMRMLCYFLTFMKVFWKETASLGKNKAPIASDDVGIIRFLMTKGDMKQR